MMFIDSHCHLNFPCFKTDFEMLLQELNGKEINKVVIPATEKKSWADIQQLSRDHKGLYYALGIHPHFLDSVDDGDLLLLKGLLKKRDKKCVAVGEIGLDKNAPTALAQQEAIFINQLYIAKQFDMPVILHVVRQQARVLAILKELKFTQGGVYHAFSGSYEVAAEFIKLGFKLGIGGVITYPNAVKTRQTLSRLPIESLLLETDAPDMPLYQQQQRHNSPANLLLVFDALVNCRSESKTSLATQIYKNTQCIFSLNND